MSRFRRELQERKRQKKTQEKTKESEAGRRAREEKEISERREGPLREALSRWRPVILRILEEMGEQTFGRGFLGIKPYTIKTYWFGFEYIFNLHDPSSVRTGSTRVGYGRSASLRSTRVSQGYKFKIAISAESEPVLTAVHTPDFREECTLNDALTEEELEDYFLRCYDHGPWEVSMD